MRVFVLLEEFSNEWMNRGVFKSYEKAYKFAKTRPFNEKVSRYMIEEWEGVNHLSGHIIENNVQGEIWHPCVPHTE